MRTAASLLTHLAAVALTGCTIPQPGPSPGPLPNPQPTPSRGLAGTTWTGPSPDGGTMHCEFFTGGKMLLSAAEGSWQQHESTVTMAVNNGYATYSGTISGTTISGTANNQAGRTWGWRITKAH